VSHFLGHISNIKDSDQIDRKVKLTSSAATWSLDVVANNTTGKDGFFYSVLLGDCMKMIMQMD